MNLQQQDAMIELGNLKAVKRPRFPTQIWESALANAAGEEKRFANISLVYPNTKLILSNSLDDLCIKRVAASYSSPFRWIRLTQSWITSDIKNVNDGISRETSTWTFSSDMFSTVCLQLQLFTLAPARGPLQKWIFR